MPTEEEIKELAYAMWEQEGRPEGKHVEHYFAAKRILEEREAAQALAKKAEAALPWQILTAELMKRKAANEPVRTLAQGVRNWIDEVGDDYVIVRSERTGRKRRITRAMIESSSAPSTRIIAALRRLGGYL